MVATGASLLALGAAEAALRLFWTNPYAGEGSDEVVILRIHQPSRDMVIDRSAVDAEEPR